VILHIEKHPEDAAALTAYFEQAQREGIESPAVEKAIALLSASGSIADAETQGRGAVHSVLERLDVRYGRTAKNMFEKLFNLMQGR